MDRERVRAVLRSSQKFMEMLDDEKHLDKLIEEIPILDKNTSSALSTSVADLISYNVTPDAYHRYSVRIKIIEMLREWIQPPIGLTSYHAFCESNNVLKLCQSMMKKYFINVINDDTISSKDIIILGKELVNIAIRDTLYIPYVKNLLNQIINSDVSFNIYELVVYILRYEMQFQLEFSLIEKLYIGNRKKFIEEPLIDGFLMNVNFQNIELFSTSSDLEKLMTYVAKSSKIFEIISSILTALFIRLKYSFVVLNYIEFILKNIVSNCENDKKTILDLYPLDIQSVIILLKINPSQHTKNSKNSILQTLKHIYLKNRLKILTILTHFPEWLEPLLNISDSMSDENREKIFTN